MPKPHSQTDSSASPQHCIVSTPTDDDAGHFRFATPEEVAFRLRRRFPDVEADIILDFAHAVSINRYSYADAKRMLTELCTFSTVEKAVTEAIEEEKIKQQRRDDERYRRYQEEYEAHAAMLITTRTVAVAQSAASSALGVSQPQHSSHQHQQQRTTATTCSGLEEIERAGFDENEVVLYVTSMTGNRQVRDHCRLLHQLLYVRRVKHTVTDIADNQYLQKRLSRLVQASHPTALQKSHSSGAHLPLLFVGEHFIGDYEYCQRLEDDNLLLSALGAHGFVHVPEPLPERPDKHLRHQEEIDDAEYWKSAS